MSYEEKEEKEMKILVTGALGFIGSHFVKYVLNTDSDAKVIGFDIDSDQWSLSRLAEVNGNKRFRMVFGDFCEDISELLEGVDIVFHFGAKTFVDHSVRSPESFIRNNVYGTFNILETIRKWKCKPFLVYISTDEVYGQTESDIPFTEKDLMNPTNPYSATKACGELLVKSYEKSFGVQYLITRCENNYGEYQHPQKVLPVYIKYALVGKPLPVYSPGLHKRKWLYVQDHCDAIWALVSNGIKNQVVNISGGCELQNIELAKYVLDYFGMDKTLIEMVDTRSIRPFHDLRYHIESSTLEALKWMPKTSLEAGMRKTIDWFKQNQWWLG